MSIAIDFQDQPDPKRRPHDESDNIHPLSIEDGQVALIPDVEDTVAYASYEYDYEANGRLIEESGREISVSRKVKTRHFSFHEGKLLYVNIVVGDVPEGEMAMRLKQ